MKKGCAQYDGKLALLYYGELAPEETNDISLHMESCPDCASAFTDIKAMLDGFAPEMPSDAQSARMVLRVKSRLAHEKKARGYMPFFAAAAAAAAAAIVISLGMPGDRPNLPAGGGNTAGTALQASITKEDWMVVENMDIENDLDIIEDLDKLEALEEI